MSWRGFGPEWNEPLAGLALIALVLVLCITHAWLPLILLAGGALGLFVAVRL